MVPPRRDRSGGAEWNEGTASEQRASARGEGRPTHVEDQSGPGQQRAGGGQRSRKQTRTGPAADAEEDTVLTVSRSVAQVTTASGLIKSTNSFKNSMRVPRKASNPHFCHGIGETVTPLKKALSQALFRFECALQVEKTYQIKLS